jgi:hypothetical protein
MVFCCSPTLEVRDCSHGRASPIDGANAASCVSTVRVKPVYGIVFFDL